MEMMKEAFSDGSLREVPAIRYKNPTSRTVRMSIHREAPVIGPVRVVGDTRPRDSRPARYLEIEVAAGGECLVPVDCTQAVQQTFCTVCKVYKLYCRDEAHMAHWTVVGGLAPQLVRLRSDGVPIEARVHPALEAPVVASAGTLADVHARTLARLAAMAGAK